MTPHRLTICAAVITIATATAAAADTAYVRSTVNLRAESNTSSEILAKIPPGTRIEANNCGEWCEVDWQGKRGYSIASALDLSGRPPPPRRTAARPAPYPADAYIEDDDDVVEPPYYYSGPYYAPPPVYYSPYRPYYRGYRGYGGSYRYGYRRGWRRW